MGSPRVATKGCSMSGHCYFAGKSRRSVRALVENLELRQMLSLTVPALSSDPAAPYNLYLDFDGDPGSNLIPKTPAFDLDANTASFSASELAAIRQIWAG